MICSSPDERIITVISKCEYSFRRAVLSAGNYYVPGNHRSKDGAAGYEKQEKDGSGRRAETR